MLETAIGVKHFVMIVRTVSGLGFASPETTLTNQLSKIVSSQQNTS